MSSTCISTMGDQGRLVVPPEVRARHGLDQGTSVIFMESPWGLVPTSREAMLARIQSVFEDSDLVEELIDQRSRTARSRTLGDGARRYGGLFERNGAWLRHEA